jgi:hypothetical protein
MPTRPLTHDQRKAAEAAYLGHPFNAAWADSARAVYQGVAKAKIARVLQQCREPVVDGTAAEVETETVCTP